MANVGWVKMGITTDVSGLKKGTHSAAEELRRLQEHVLHAAEAFGVFEVAKHAFETIKGSIEAISQTKILAERVGMSAEAFGKLSYAARLAHMDQDSLAVSLEQMSKRLGEVAIEGSGPAADALKRLGLNAGKLARMGNEGAFYKIISVLEGIKNPAERSAVAMDLFGKSGQAMINLVAQGGEEIKRSGEEALRLGVALNQLDTAKVEEADQAFIKLSAAGQGFTNMLAVQLAPYITYVTEKYLDFGYAGTKSATFIARGLDLVQTGMGYVLDVINVGRAAWYGLQSAVTGMFEAQAKGIQMVLQGWNWIIDKLATAAEWMAKFTGQSAEAAKAIGDAVRGGPVGRGSKAAEEFFANWTEELDRVRKEQIGKATEAFNNVGGGKATITNLMDEFVGKANERAKGAADKSKAFVAPGALAHEKVEAQKFGGALDLGSKDAYSSILRSRGMQQGQTEQRKIASATERTAAGVARTVQVLERLAGTGGIAGQAGKMMLDLPGAH